MKGFLPNHTSVDDMRSSLYLWKPNGRINNSAMIAILRESIIDETKNRNRATVIKLLNAKIKSLENLK